MNTLFKLQGIALLEMLLVLTLLSAGLVAMLKVYSYNEIFWQRLIGDYCDYLQRSETRGQQKLAAMGVITDWDEGWLLECSSAWEKSVAR